MQNDTPSTLARTMNRAATLTLSILLACSLADAQYIPPDRLGGEHQGTDVLRRNNGQVFDTDGNQRRDVKAYFEGSPVGIYLRDSSRVSFTYATMFMDSVIADTSYRVDMAFSGAKPMAPHLLLPSPGVANYYRSKHATELVPAYYRGIYEEVLYHIDLHMYASSGGPRMAFVVRPGGDPSTIKLMFTGQDSLGIDWLGSLKVYLSGKWVELKEATAYQVTSNGSMVDVPWTPQWVHENGTVYATISFGDYDPALPLVLQIGYAAMGGAGGPDDRDMNWSTYVGGAGDDELTCVETDENGNAYTCGHTLATNFPVAPGNQHYPPFQPAAAGYDNAVIMKFDGTSKRVEWATYYGGANANPATQPEEPHARTEARKLAVYTWNNPDLQHVFATGVTNCTDFNTWIEPLTIFSNAVQEGYGGGRSRMWLGAFKKSNGIRDWATTHGQGNGQYDSREEGLAIAINQAGQLAVGGRLHRTVNYSVANPVFPLVTPAGAYDHNGNTGGAFIMSFNPDFTIRWASTLGNYDQVAYTQLTDLRYESTGRWLWFTGISSGSLSTLDLVTPTGSYSNQFGSAMIGEFNMSTGPGLDYCTRWGGGPITDPSSLAYGLDYDGKYIWVVGGTRRSAVTETDAPLPTGPSTIYHSVVNASDPAVTGNLCDGFILKFDVDQHTLLYGTLIGGNNYDMLLDVGHDADNVYITGESRSTGGFAADLNPLRYFQPMNGNVNTRDAVLLAIRSGDAAPEMVWRTAYGGTASERGWGIAGSLAQPSDVYIVGGAASQPFQMFPLHEFSTSSTLDYYQPLNLTGAGASGSLNSWYRFEYGLDFENGTLGFATPEASHQGHDGFIASFAADHPVGIGEHAESYTEDGLLVTPLPAYGQWAVHFPNAGEWKLMAFNAAGQVVGNWNSHGTAIVDLSKQAAGMYILRAVTLTGESRRAKVVRP